MLPQLKSLTLVMDEEYHHLTPKGPIKGESAIRDLILSKGVVVDFQCVALDRIRFRMAKLSNPVDPWRINYWVGGTKTNNWGALKNRLGGGEDSEDA
jgi:hypothetical protein